MPSTNRPSRALNDLLRSPQSNTPSHLLVLANESLSDLYNTQITARRAHSEARKRFVIAKAYFDELNGKREARTKEARKELCMAEEMYERAWRELEVRRGKVEKCDNEIEVLKGDINFLTKSMKERSGGDVRRVNGQGSPRALGEVKRTGSDVFGYERNGGENGIGYAM